jgi:signal peptidase I
MKNNQDTSTEQSTINWKKEASFLAMVLLIAMTIRTLGFELFYVPTGSMKATILEGDYIFSTKYDYGYSKYSIAFSPNIFQGRIFAKEPNRGDIVIMRPPHNMNERYIKRLIGLPGEKVQIIDDVIYINNVAIEREEVGAYTDEKGTEFRKFQEKLPNGCSYFSYKMKYPPRGWQHELHSNFGPHIIEAGHYFFIGDNRDNSGDSRYQLGTVPFENFIAKGKMVVFSAQTPLWDNHETLIGQIKRFGTWLSSIRTSRIFTNLSE